MGVRTDITLLSDRVGDRVGALTRRSAQPGDVRDALLPAGLPDLYLVECTRPGRLELSLSQPLVCLTLQGSLETRLNDDTIIYRAAETVIIGHDVPMVTQVIEASASGPFRALIYGLDVTVLRELQSRLGNTRLDHQRRPVSGAPGIHPELIRSFDRYFSLLRNPVDARILASSASEELHYRTLQAHHGLIRRRLLKMDSHAGKVARAIRYLRKHFRESIAMEQLAREAGMGLTSFHTHFREVTGTTPKQYQKELRMLEARRLLVENGLPVSAVAYQVGYKSPTQFSREYSKKFGEPPSKRVSIESKSA